MLASGAEVDKDIIQTFTLGDGEVIAGELGFVFSKGFITIFNDSTSSVLNT